MLNLFFTVEGIWYNFFLTMNYDSFIGKKKVVQKTKIKPPMVKQETK